MIRAARPVRTAPAVPNAAVRVDARLLAVAAEHVRRLGPERVTVVGVAREAGMTHANVYRYFPSKLALVDAVAGQWLKSLEARLAEIADAPDPADDKLERLLLALARAHRALLVQDRHLFDVVAGATAAARGIARKHRARLRHLIERILDEGGATGTFEPRDRERAVAFVFDASHRFIAPASVRLDAEVPEDLLAARLNSVIRAVQHALARGVV